MSTRFVTATEFKAKCLGLIDEVEAKGESITVTRRGRPVVVIQPATRKRLKSPMGILSGKVKVVGDIVHTPHLWDGFAKG
jgi:prevent-host-death family protein